MVQNPPLLPIEYFFLNRTIFIADLASVSHNIRILSSTCFFFQLKSAQILRNILSTSFSDFWRKISKSQTGQTPLINGKNVYVYFGRGANRYVTVELTNSSHKILKFNQF